MANLNELTIEQRNELLAQLKEQEAAEKAARAAEIEAYKKLVSESVVECFAECKEVSAMLADRKTKIREMFADALTLKEKLYGVKEGQQSHSFISEDGRYRIKLGYYVLESYDDTAETGVAMIKEYLAELSATSPKAQEAVNIVMSLLARDQQGNLKMSRIMTLRKHAQESGNEKFMRGVDVIMDAYRPIKSKEYIKAEYKNELGTWVNVPLGMTEA